MVCLKGKVAIITGSSGGIGAETAVHFAELGASVTITGRKEDKLNEVKGRIEKAGGKALVIVGDVTKDETRQKLINDTVKTFGKLDVLVNNAGAGVMAQVHEGKLDQLDWVMDLNVRSVVAMCTLALPHLQKTKGSIINISSVAALVPSGFYGMSKAALDHYTKSLAGEVGPMGVRVNSVNPAAVETNFLEGVLPNCSEDMKNLFYEKVASGYPLQKVGHSINIAKAIAFFASEESEWTTGSILVVDGGMMSSNPMMANLKPLFEKLAGGK